MQHQKLLQTPVALLIIVSTCFFACDLGLNDDNYESHAGISGETITGITYGPNFGRPIDDTLKFSNASDMIVENCIIYGGSEDCIDINRLCDEILIKDCVLIPLGQQAVTIKGGSSNITLQNVVIHPGATDCDIELGMYAHTGNNPVTGVKLINVTKSDGSAVRLNVWNADIPVIQETKAFVNVISPVIWGVYFFGRDNKIW